MNLVPLRGDVVTTRTTGGEWRGQEGAPCPIAPREPNASLLTRYDFATGTHRNEGDDHDMRASRRHSYHNVARLHAYGMLCARRRKPDRSLLAEKA